MKQDGVPIRVGDHDGLGVVYSEFGHPILRPGEREIRRHEECELAVYNSWRMLFPKRVFDSLPGKPSGVLHVTNERLIFLRRIDVWREVKPLLTPLGLPAAAEKESRLQRLKASGALQYCEISTPMLKLVRLKKKKGLSHFRFITKGGGRYEIFVRTKEDDHGFVDFLEEAMRQPNRLA